MDNNPYKTNESWDKDDADMKKRSKFGVFKMLLMGLGAIFLLIILLFVWVGIKTSAVKNDMEGKAEPVIKQVLAEQSPWDYDKLEPYLSQLWLEQVEEQDARKLLELFKKLGEVVSVGEISLIGCSTMSTTEFGTINRCNYAVVVHYAAGEAQVLMGMVLENDNAKLLQLNINSDVFAE